MSKACILLFTLASFCIILVSGCVDRSAEMNNQFDFDRENTVEVLEENLDITTRGAEKIMRGLAT